RDTETTLMTFRRERSERFSARSTRGETLYPMTLTRLLRRGLVFHRRANLAVLLGVAVGTAVLTGALLVGDSLRGSLRDRALRQLGWVEDAMVSGRFVRQQIAQDLNDTYVERGITLRATVEKGGKGDAAGRPVSGVTVWATRADLNHQSMNPPLTPDPGWRVWQYLPPF